MNEKLEVRDTLKKGKGVFAKSEIPAGERLAIFGGVILTLEEESLLPKKFQDTGLQIAENFVITTKDKKEDTDCFNHSCEPNAGFNGQLFLVAMKDIVSGDEIVFDYAMVLYNGNEDVPYALDCECGSPACRGVITTNDWTIPELRSRYAGYFQDYLERKIHEG